jgi:acyl dehydratase
MSESLPLGIDPALIGAEFDSSISEPVTAEDIRTYADSVGETHPAYVGPNPIAPPTFCVKFHGARFHHTAIPREAFRGGFDAGKDIQFGVPIRPGDVIHTRNVLYDVYEKTGRSGSMVFVVSRQTMTNQRGEMVAVVDSRFMLRPRERAE